MNTRSQQDLISYLKANFIYHKNGTLTRSDRKNSCGSFDKDGYLIIKIKGKQYKAHRLVFAMFYGRFPEKEIDHINRIRSDNRIENLREVDHITNIRNATIPPNKETGVVGVYVDKTDGLKKKYAFNFMGKTYRFYTISEAVKAKEVLKNEYPRKVI